MALQILGEVETPKLIFREARKRVPASDGARSSRPHLAPQAYWRGVPHWNVPPAFEDAAKAYSELGEEAYIAAVNEYYGNIRELGVERSQRTHAKWVVRSVLRTFETHIRGYRHQAVGRRGGALFHTASDELIHPQTLWESGQLVADLNGIIARYQVRSDLREVTVRLVRAKLTALWGLS
jgi:hypothetical protein